MSLLPSASASSCRVLTVTLLLAGTMTLAAQAPEIIGSVDCHDTATATPGHPARAICLGGAICRLNPGQFPWRFREQLDWAYTSKFACNSGTTSHLADIHKEQTWNMNQERHIYSSHGMQYVEQTKGYTNCYGTHFTTTEIDLNPARCQ